MFAAPQETCFGDIRLLLCLLKGRCELLNRFDAFEKKRIEND